MPPAASRRLGPMKNKAAEHERRLCLIPTRAVFSDSSQLGLELGIVPERKSADGNDSERNGFYLVALGLCDRVELGRYAIGPMNGTSQAKPTLFNRLRRSFDIPFLFRRCVATHQPSLNPFSR